jgi:hypothetical protein
MAAPAAATAADGDVERLISHSAATNLFASWSGVWADRRPCMAETI